MAVHFFLVLENEEPSLQWELPQGVVKRWNEVDHGSFAQAEEEEK